MLKRKLPLLLLLNLFLPSILFAGELASRGVAFEEVEPDQVAVHITVQVDADTQKEAAEGAGSLLRAVEEEIGRLPSENITVQTVGLRITPVYYYRKTSRSISYYNASASWTVEGRAVEEILAMVGSLGSRDYEEKAFVGIDGLSWGLSRDLQERVKTRLIAEAVRGARAKAVAALEALDLTLKGVKRIDLEDAAADRLELDLRRKPMPMSAALETEQVQGEVPLWAQPHRGKIPMEVQAVMVVDFQ